MRNFLKEPRLSSFHTVFVVLYINLVILGVAIETEIHYQQIEGLSIGLSLKACIRSRKSFVVIRFHKPSGFVSLTFFKSSVMSLSLASAIF
jgi:hypothetical protein